MELSKIIKYSLFSLIDLSLISILGISGLVYMLFGSPIKRSISKNNNTVILIHGTGVSDWQWANAKLYLYLSKIPCFSVKYDHSQSINISCENVKNQIISYCQLQNNNNIIVIGHSQGGLIARCIHNEINSKMSFLINAPQKGAPIINWLYPESQKHKYSNSLNDMRPNSNFIENLPNIEDHERIYEIIGLNDIVGAENCISFGKYIYISWFGHYFSAVNPYLWYNYIIPKIRKCQN